MSETRAAMLLEAHNIDRTYFQGKEELRVVKDVSLKVEKGEFVVQYARVCRRAGLPQEDPSHIFQ